MPYVDRKSDSDWPVWLCLDPHWLLLMYAGVFHLDLKADNIVNNRLIDLDNYFFQGEGHLDWCMSG